MIGGTISLLYSVDQIPVLRNQREKFDKTISVVVNQLFPAVATLGFTLQRNFTGYTDMLTPLLGAMAQTVPTPQLSSAQLREIVSRMDKSFTDTPDGPALNLALTLRGVPALSVPLLGALPIPMPGGGR
jgi:hypothetical protein